MAKQNSYAPLTAEVGAIRLSRVHKPDEGLISRTLRATNVHGESYVALSHV